MRGDGLHHIGAVDTMVFDKMRTAVAKAEVVVCLVLALILRRWENRQVRIQARRSIHAQVAQLERRGDPQDAGENPVLGARRGAAAALNRLATDVRQGYSCDCTRWQSDWL